MITEKQLQDYARKIYEQQDGYTIEKAYKLFARLAIRISMYLNQLYIQEMKEKMTKLNAIFIGQYQNELAQLDKEFNQLEKLNAKFSNQDISNMTLEQMMNTGILQQQYNIGQTGINMIDKYTKLSLKWKKIAQDAIYKLIECYPQDEHYNPNTIKNVIHSLNLDKDLLGYDSENDCFTDE